MVIEPLSILTLFGVTIVLGYVGSFIFKKTRIPDVIWLLLFGIIVGPLFNLVDTEIFMTASPLLGAVALLIILFDAGLHMNLYQIMKKISRSILLAFLGIFCSAIGIGFVSIFLFQFDWISGLILGLMISGTSSAIVISMVDPMRIKNGVKTILKLESIITDPVIIVLAIALMQIAVTTLEPATLVNSLASTYSIAIVIGLISAMVWLIILDKIKGREFDYMLTLAIAFLLYVFVETIGGSGSIAALIFGLVLGNSVAFSRMFKLRKRYRTNKLLKRFQTEITFFVRSFFFVYLGLIISIDFVYLLYGVLITVLALFIRFFVVQISTFKMSITKVEKNVMRIMFPRGLAAAVLAQMPLTYGIAGGDIFLNISFTVIFLSVLLTAVFTRISYKPEVPEKIEVIKKVKTKK